MKTGNGMLIKVLIAMMLALIAGYLTGPEAEIFGVPYLQIYSLMGQLFLNALTLVVVPLVAASIITGAARMGGEHSFKKLGAKTFGFFIGTSAMAVLVGLTLTLILEPGSMPISSTVGTAVPETMNSFLQNSNTGAFDKISGFLYKMVPSNILSAAAQGQMLGVILFSLLFGYFITKIDEHPAAVLLGFWKGVFQVMMRITQLVMRALPLGVFGLVAKVVATTGFEAFSALALFTLTIVASLIVYAFIVLPILLFLVGTINPIAHFRAVGPALFTAFSTSSSAAALPFTLECMEKKVGVSNRICSFAIPLGTSMSMSGSALYICVSALFIAQTYGVELSGAILTLVPMMAVLTSIGVAGIPSACLISLVLILNTIGVPVEGIALLFATERILDMLRTTVNVLGNTCCVALVARSENEATAVQLTPLQKVGG